MGRLPKDAPGPELIIMTPEILRMMLTHRPLDWLISEQVKAIVIDEFHQFNNSERGQVIEDIVRFTPKNIQQVYLTATLTRIDPLIEWLRTHRETDYVVNSHRHVPLIFGGFVGPQTETFVTYYDTSTDIIDRAALKRVATVPHKQLDKFVNQLNNNEMCPAIYFLMSQGKCETYAFSINANLILGERIPLPPPGANEFELQIYESDRAAQSKVVGSKLRKFKDLYRRYLGSYDKYLKVMPSHKAWIAMLERGVAYHHAGMVSVMREFVEVLFAERMIHLCFATSTLAVGINMPAKTVVFGQLDVPQKSGSRVPLDAALFKQMMGRAGRRGIDTKGFVLFHIDEEDRSNQIVEYIKCEAMTAQSQTRIDPMYVLANVSQNQLKTTFLWQSSQQSNSGIIRERELLLKKVQEFGDSSAIESILTRMTELRDRLDDRMFTIKPKKRKEMEKEYEGYKKYAELNSLRKQIKDLDRDIDNNIRWMTDSWDQSVSWLKENGYLEIDSDNFTLRGLICSRMQDAYPLIRGKCLADGMLNGLSSNEIISWLALFIEAPKISEDTELPSIYPMSESLKKLIDQSVDLSFDEKEPINNDSIALTKLVWWWVNAIENLALDPSSADLTSERNPWFMLCRDVQQLGKFISAIRRLSSLFKETKTIVDGLQNYELLIEMNEPDIYYALVSNSSIYVPQG